MNVELMSPPVIEVTPRRFTIKLTEQQARNLVESLKFSQTHIPNLTEPVWVALEQALGYIVTESLI